jgi:hypothetical protein
MSGVVASTRSPDRPRGDGPAAAVFGGAHQEVAHDLRFGGIQLANPMQCLSRRWRCFAYVQVMYLAPRMGNTRGLFDSAIGIDLVVAGKASA